MSGPSKGNQQDLLRNLTHELFQTEVSASRHCRREARRNPDTPPAWALLTVAEHADSALKQLTELAGGEGLPVSIAGGMLGAMFSEVRERVADRLLDGERSYRATLLGIRHGTDVMRMFESTASLAGHSQLAEWAHRWLVTRSALVRELERELQWFAQHVERALARAH